MLQSEYPTTLGQETGIDVPSVTIHKNTEDSSELASDVPTDGGSSSASSSDESTATTKGVAETLKEEVIGKIILAMTEWLRSRFIQMHKSAGEPTTSSFGSGSAPSGTSEQPSQGQVQPTHKRKLGDRNNNRDGDDDEDDDSPIAPPYLENDRKGKGKEILRLACPYFKYNPTKYQQWPICPGPGWLNVHRVKEHLYRKHRQARFRCLRCWEHFESEQNYFDHQRAPIPCELGEREPIEGFNADQERQLKSRKKKGHVVSETEKWRAVFQILFPHVPIDDIPSPYYDYGQLTSPTTKAHEALAECEEYFLRELPLRLREILVPEFDRDLQIIEQSLQKRAIESTKTILATLFQEFRKLQQHDTPPTMTQEPSGSQDHAGPSSSGAELSCLDAIDSHRMIFDSTEFNLDFLLGTDSGLSPFQDVQLEDIPEAPTDPDNCTLKKSDSGYGSNNQEQPDQEAEDSV
ncbi:hypothetical protein GGS24DRAFT_499620 [Hypoxylon argillaceum]|nr:hypothetical protein GGS24DRAFT_499620 [Hypoxylon argillaceum]